MVPTLTSLFEIGCTIAAAALCGMLATRARLPSVLGYLAAGITLGPFTPGYVVQSSTIAGLAQIGVGLLLFGFGISFAARGFARVSRFALAANAVCVSLLATALWFCAALLGSTNPVAIATTGGLATLAIAAAVLRQAYLSRGGHVIVLQAFLVVQNSAALAFLAAIVLPGAPTLGAALGISVRTILFVMGSLLVAVRILPRLARALSRVALRLPHWCSVAALAAVAIPFAFAAGSAGLPIGVGTFAAGLALARCAETGSLARAILRFRAIVAVLIFVALGTVFDPRLFVNHWLAIAILLSCTLFAAVIAVRSRSLRTASPVMLLALIAPLMDLMPVADFHAMFGNIALHANNLSDTDQLSIVMLVVIALAVTVVSGILMRDESPPDREVLVVSLPPFSERR